MMKSVTWIFKTNKRVTRARRHVIIALLVLLHMFWSSPSGAQPPTNPNIFGRGPDWLGVFGILFFSCPVIWVLLSKFGSFLRSRTYKPFWEQFWGFYFVAIGLMVWIAAVIYVFWKW